MNPRLNHASAAAVAVTAWLGAAGAGAQNVRVASPETGAVRAVRATSAIRVDGRLDDAAWTAAPVHADFVQRDPDEGQPSSERTEVRVVYDSHALYVGGRLYDSDPRRIRARLARRDEPIWNADVLEVYIDSQNDGLSAYVFRITPAGALRDATMDANLGQDNSWDAVWEGAAVLDSLGWSTEIKIPFGQLRYSTGPSDTLWGIQFSRVIGWRGETSFLPSRPKATAQSPADWSKLVGLHELPREKNLEIAPYLGTRAEYLQPRPGNPFRTRSDYHLNAGLDLRYGLSNNLTLSGTVNPDFGQVEVDPARINLTQNELFFPERRPFFVESAEMFRFGQARLGTGSGFPPTFFLTNISSMSGVLNGFTPEVFHSRRIGRTPQRDVSGQYDYVDAPEEVTIGAAAKLTGRTARGLSVGLLDAVTTREKASVANVGGERLEQVVEPETNYLVGRARQELRGGNTVLGALVTAVNRRLDDPAPAAVLRRDAYFAGLDFNQSWRQRVWSLDAAFGGSFVGGTPEAIAATQRSPVRYLQRPDRVTDPFDPTRRTMSGTAFHAGLAKNGGRHWLGNLFYRQVSSEFEVNDVGFHTLAGVGVTTWSVAYKEDIPGRLFRAYQARPYGLAFRNLDGFHGATHTGISAEATFRNFWQLLVRPEHVEGGFDPYLSRGGPLMRRADRNRLELALTSDRRASWTLDFGYARETDDLDAWLDSYMIAYDWRPISQLRLNLTPAYTNRLVATQYVAQFADDAAAPTFGRRYVFGSLRYRELSVTTRTDWSFSPSMSLQVFAQPLVAAGRYLDFKSLAAPRTTDFDLLSEFNGTLLRENGTLVFLPGGAAFRVPDPNFKTRTLVGNAVLRWEYRPGSTLFFVWQQRRDGLGDDFDLSAARDLRAVFRDHPQNVFVLKGTYWIRW